MDDGEKKYQLENQSQRTQSSKGLHLLGCSKRGIYFPFANEDRDSRENSVMQNLQHWYEKKSHWKEK